MNEKELLKKLYLDENKSLREIAKMFKTTKVTVSSRLKKYGIPVRLRGVQAKVFTIENEE